MTRTGRTAWGGRVVAAAAGSLAIAAVIGVLFPAHAPAHAGIFNGVASITSSGAAITIKSGSCTGGGSSFCYSPESAAAAKGGKVVWTNQSGFPHTASRCTAAACPGAPASTGSNTFNVSIGSSNGSSGSFTFTSAGTYYYYCMIHGYSLMHGKITIFAAPTIGGFTPSSGHPGTTVTITGQHLAPASKVTFHGTAATITSDSQTKITAVVPIGATTGHITVTTPGGTATSAAVFTVT